MHVDARDVPVSSILAIVVTLASVALLSFSLRLFTRGRLPRSLDTDDWLLLVAALCVVGVLVIAVVLRVENQAWSTTPGGDHTMSLLVWVSTLLHILGIGFIKLSVALTVLKHAVRGWHRHTVLGYICLTTILTVLWLGSALLFDGPITVEWRSDSEPDATWRLLGFINSVLDVATNALLTLLPIPLLENKHLRLSVKTTLLVVYAFTTAAVAAAIVRTYHLHAIWRDEDPQPPSPSSTLWSTIELTLSTIAASLCTLPLTSPTSHLPTTKHLSTTSSPQSHPSYTSPSTTTIIHHPTPHLLTLRFHDPESNLDFDIESPSHTRTRTLRSQTTHTRNLSDWSQFSGFTYYTTPAASVHNVSAHDASAHDVSAHDASPRRSRAVSMQELEQRTRGIGAGRSAAGAGGIGVAVTTLHDVPVCGEEGGEEMAVLAGLFADRGRVWGEGMG